MNELIHVYPINDLREHTQSLFCWCQPVLLDDKIVVHNSMDQREKYETGERLPS